MLSREILIDAIERSDCMLPEIPGMNEYIDLPGVRLCVAPVNDFHANKAMMARLDGKDVDSTIEHVKEYFGARGTSFSWIVGPRTTPLDLGERLRIHGLEEKLRVDGLYLPDLNPVIAVNESVRILELPPDGLDPVIPIMAAGFETNDEDARFFHAMIAASAPTVVTRTYLAFLDGVDHPVACGYVTYFPDQPIALLCGGATLPEFRGKGVYRTMLAHRLADIRRDGIESVILLADQRTSSPICIRNGFVKLCELQFHIWQPR